ncbi:GerAB/ArcD/ProY family transporter [Hazenella coriacea]|uniref:Spore germination protein (Amino acid permease) n=1 Tax=Hazenella coriacea TaxID=1179467 RepID=A0A4R3L247_9BACL|nr:endospore germination permease [Hazenella coriacea]TCS93613.1 spore germination protein (amino acid permease) [Hazenella coriacea]
MKKQSISFLQFTIITFTVIGLMNHVIIIPLLLETTKRDSWLSVLIAGVLLLLWIPILYITNKKMKGQKLLPWLKKHYGGFVAYPLIAVIIVFVFSIAVITLKETLTFLSFYLPETPMLVLGFFLLLICFINAHGGIHSIAYTLGILLPFVFVLGFFVAFANFPHKDYSFLKPILENGWDLTFNGLIYPAAGFIELILFLMIQHHIRTPVKFFPLFFIGLGIVGLTVGPTIGAIIEFGPFVAAKQRFPAFEEWRLVIIGRYIEHLDFLSVYQWLVGAFGRISLALFVIPDLFQIQRVKIRDRWIMVLAILTLIASTLPISDVTVHWFLARILLPSSLIAMLTISIILAILSLIASKKKGGQNYDIS